MTELLHSTAADLAGLIASKASSREVTQAHLDRIDAVDGSVRAFCTSTVSAPRRRRRRRQARPVSRWAHWPMHRWRSKTSSA
ncbi:MAG: hypothetical protein R2742_10490 [Micropruina glycogenica]